MEPVAYHALVLNFHQPAGNLNALLGHAPWEVEQILYAMDRMPRSLWGYEDVARVHLSLSGTLLETLRDPDFQAEVYGWVDCGSLLWYLQNRLIFDILGTGFYHPVFPLIPSDDWKEQLHRWQGIAQHLFWRTDFDGLWPPELGFCMEMIPTLRSLGYTWAIVDVENIKAITPMSWEALRYRPHIAKHEGHEFIVIPRDRDLSNAQESGMEYSWFAHEVGERVKHADFSPLITTCTDGENGGWFRNIEPEANFWGAFYRPMLDAARSDAASIKPIFIRDYLREHPPYGQVWVNTAAWNTGDHSGLGFVQWTGSQAQKDGLARIRVTSEAIHALKRKADDSRPIQTELEQAYWHCLRAETSCNFYWGDAWVPKAHDDLDRAWEHIHRARAQLQ